ncbi:MAG: metal-dependent transcriptional regulator [Armatimonadetes bacterium]|nr:metal-dependent transcriptional regulator [Armatimonadota bacterium]
MKSTPTISASVEDYLTAIYRLTPAGKAVGPTRLAEFMGLSAPSITLMVRRLSEQGLVLKDNGHGVVLSTDGECRALEVLRRHRLAERFLVDKLGLNWGMAHVEAHRFEHALSAEVTDALERFLGHPETCPHGNPIPDPEGRVPVCNHVLLSDLGIGDRAMVRSVDDESMDVLLWLEQVGLVPSTPVQVEQVDPRGTLLLRTPRGSVAVGSEVARGVRAEKLED